MFVLFRFISLQVEKSARVWNVNDTTRGIILRIIIISSVYLHTIILGKIEEFERDFFQILLSSTNCEYLL